MRVTNSMMVNNTINNIFTNKSLMDKLNTQLATKKKITKPSEDPVAAIRSLKLRSSLNEISQYYEKNIPDATSWLNVTETALTKTKDILDDFYKQCVYGASDQLKPTDRQTILTDLTALKDQIYAQGNTDYAGRYVFAGYKTDSSLTFLSEEPTTQYQIKESFTGEAVEDKTVLTNQLSIGATLPATVGSVTYPESETIYRIRLSYDNLDTSNFSMSLNGTAVTDFTTYANGKVTNSAGVATTEGMYEGLGADEVRYIPETGEVIFGSDISKTVKAMTATGGTSPISISYRKTGFEQGDLKPEHYFNCTKSPGTPQAITYTKTDQNIEYDISFNQSLNINIEADAVYSPDIYRDVEDLIDIVQAAIDAEAKVTKITSMQSDSQYSANKDVLSAMLDAAKKEAELAENNMKTAYSEGMTKSQGYLDDAELAISECGGRTKRLQLTQTRLKEQTTNFKALLSTNEDIDYEAVAVEYNSAESGYKASLMAAQSLSSISLLDYLS